MQTLYRFLFVAAALLIVVSTVAYAPFARAQEAQPLVVIRFNQARVYYDQQLYSAVSQAVSIKPDVTFDIVSNAPSTGNSSKDDQWIVSASRNTQAVVSTMKSIGVPMERMRVSGQAVPGLAYDETRIYAR